MKRNSLWFYAVVIGLALAVPRILHLSDKKQAASKAARAKDGDRIAAPEPATIGVAAPGAAAGPALAKPLAELPESFGTLSTDRFRARVSSLTGGLQSFELRDASFQTHGKPLNIVTTSRPEYYPLTSRIEGAAIDTGAGWQLEQLSDTLVRLHTQADGVAVERKLEAGKGPYQIWVTTTLANRGSAPRKLKLSELTFHYVARAEESGGIPLLPARSSAMSSGLCDHGDEFERIDRKKLEEPKRWPGPVRFAGIDNVYFLNAIVSADDSARGCALEGNDRGLDSDGKPIGTLIAARLTHDEFVVQPGQSRTVRVLAYLGPKTPEELARVGHSLRKAINSGFFTSVADVLTWLLQKIHSGVGNWGVAIILLTFLVKLVLYPLTHKQMESMAKMKELKPEMDRINELYADDREKKGAAVMELYRKKGVNPMAGCFPVVLQLPIWFSLYASLSSNIQLFHAPFALWWHDLSSPDPYFVLPLCLGVLMFVQQKLAPPAGTDPMQAKMMLYMMPTMITSFMLFLPAGLCLYMFTNSALSILQQRVIEARLKKRPPGSPQSPATSLAAVAQDADKDTHASKSNPAPQRLRRGRK
jgi:YidC/Oxa1 family membrane protein insertase